MRSAAKILVLHNARSGHKRLRFPAYLKALEKLGAQVETRAISRSNLKELLADARNFDRIVIAGGDGTISAAAGILQNTSVPIMAYPGGTGNLLARNLGLPSNSTALADITLNGALVKTDLGELEYGSEKIHFAIMAGCGFSARMVSHALPYKPIWGEAAYWLSAFWNLFPPRAEFELTLDGQKVRARGIGVLIINFEKIQFDLKVLPGSHSQDGRFEIAIVTARSLFGLIPILWSSICARLGFVHHPVPAMMQTYRATAIEIASDPALKLQVDGEILEKTGHFRIRVCPGAALFISKINT